MYYIYTINMKNTIMNNLENYWNHEYRHYLRDARPHEKDRIKNLFIKNNLELDGESDAHLDIIKKVLPFFFNLHKYKNFI